MRATQLVVRPRRVRPLRQDGYTQNIIKVGGKKGYTVGRRNGH